jgi:hypothetical protein
LQLTPLHREVSSNQSYRTIAREFSLDVVSDDVDVPQDLGRLLLPGLAGHIDNDLVVIVVDAAATVAGVLLDMCADGPIVPGHAAVVDHAFAAATLRQLARVVSAAREARPPGGGSPA